jgi:hypothetical protein
MTFTTRTDTTSTEAFHFSICKITTLDQNKTVVWAESGVNVTEVGVF